MIYRKLKNNKIECNLDIMQKSEGKENQRRRRSILASLTLEKIKGKVRMYISQALIDHFSLQALSVFHLKYPPSR